MRVFKTRSFNRWMRKTHLRDAVLCTAVLEMTQGLIDADLGGGALKKRVPLPGRGKSGGAHTLVATNKDDRWFFVFGFEKNQQSNISPRELEALQKIAADLMKLSSIELDGHAGAGSLTEICHGNTH